MHRAIVVGSYNQDYLWRVDSLPRSGETLAADNFISAPGGKGFNQAIACARQGVVTHFIGAVGKDVAGDAAKSLARSEGLISRWQTVSAATGSAGIFVDQQGNNAIAVALGANQQLTADFIKEYDADFAKSQIVLLQLETNLACVEAALAQVNAHALRCVINPAPMNDALPLSFLHQADVITPNETEFIALLNLVNRDHRLNAATLAQQDDATLAQLCARLGAGCVIITLGAQGCFVCHNDHSTVVGSDSKVIRLAAETVNAIDTTGAGDAFNGGLVAAMCLLADKPFSEQVRYANRVAALSTLNVGAAIAMPYRHELERRFNNASSRLDRID